MRRISTMFVMFALVLVFAAPLSATAATVTLQDMFREQVASQEMIGALFSTPGSGSAIKKVYFRTVYKSRSKVAVRLAVRFANGQRVPGVMILRKYNGKWYCYSITRGASSAAVSSPQMPVGIDSSVVRHAMSEQGAHQYIITGIISGGYEKMTVTGRGVNAGTRRISVTMSRGSRRSKSARVYGFLSTASNGDQYWFINAIK